MGSVSRIWRWPVGLRVQEGIVGREGRVAGGLGSGLMGWVWIVR